MTADSKRLAVTWGYDRGIGAGWVDVNGEMTYDCVESPQECAAIAFAIQSTRETSWEKICPYVQLLLQEEVDVPAAPDEDASGEQEKAGEP